MAIYTIVHNQSGEQLVEQCDHATWRELINDGWEFIGTKGPHVLMIRKGYINEFWEY
ncbi:MAG: hypothetical protein GTO02_13500 [Candidatus Dadabacteria bacterium]|nr:hypothetical protein [Candidatus Dadabacteria bacterium]